MYRNLHTMNLQRSFTPILILTVWTIFHNFSLEIYWKVQKVWIKMCVAYISLKKLMYYHCILFAAKSCHKELWKNSVLSNAEEKITPIHLFSFQFKMVHTFSCFIHSEDVVFTLVILSLSIATFSWKRGKKSDKLSNRTYTIHSAR